MSADDEDEGTYYEMQERFNQAMSELINTKTGKCILFTRDKYMAMVELVKLAKMTDRKKEPSDYRRLKRYEIYREGDSERLISPPTEDDGDTIRHFVYIEETFDIIHKAHHELNHAGRSRLEKHIHAKYNNITKESINLYLKFCKICQRRRNGEISFQRTRQSTTTRKIVQSAAMKRQKPGQKLLAKTEKALTGWLLDKASKGMQISDRQLREKALALYGQIAETAPGGLQQAQQQFKASKDWLYRFRTTFNQQHSVNCFSEDHEAIVSSNGIINHQLHKAQNGGYDYSVLDQLIGPSSPTTATNHNLDVDDDHHHNQHNQQQDDSNSVVATSWNYSKFHDVLQTASYLTDMITRYDPNRERSRSISKEINNQLNPYREMFDLLKDHERTLISTSSTTGGGGGPSSSTNSSSKTCKVATNPIYLIKSASISSSIDQLGSQHLDPEQQQNLALLDHHPHQHHDQQNGESSTTTTSAQIYLNHQYHL